MYCGYSLRAPFILSFFFFNDTATTEIYTLSLHDALPIYMKRITLPKILDSLVYLKEEVVIEPTIAARARRSVERMVDRKSTRLNSSHLVISYAVFCLKKKKRAPILR